MLKRGDKVIYSLLTTGGAQSLILSIFIYAIMWLIIPIVVILIIHHINKKNKKH